MEREMESQTECNFTRRLSSLGWHLLFFLFLQRIWVSEQNNHHHQIAKRGKLRLQTWTLNTEHWILWTASEERKKNGMFGKERIVGRKTHLIRSCWSSRRVWGGGGECDWCVHGVCMLCIVCRVETALVTQKHIHIHDSWIKSREWTFLTKHILIHSLTPFSQRREKP